MDSLRRWSASVRSLVKSAWQERLRRISPVWFLLGIGFLFGAALLFYFGVKLQYGHFTWHFFFVASYGNLGAGLVDTVVTILVIDSIARRTERRQVKREFITSLRSASSSSAGELLERAREKGWLRDGTLAGADLVGAQLERCDLEGARLVRVDFTGAILKGSNMFGASLNQAHFIRADMGAVDLRLAHLRETSLYRANLQHSQLDGSDLRGAVMRHADLQSASMERCKFDGRTILPDGTKWSPTVDISIFTLIPSNYRDESPE